MELGKTSPKEALPDDKPLARTSRSSSDLPNDQPSPLKHEITAQDAPASASEAANRVKSADGKNAFLTGWMLFFALSGVTVVMLLAMLDMAIIGTVGSSNGNGRGTELTVVGYSSNYE